MRFLRILIVTAGLFSFFICLYPAAKTLSKADEMEQEKVQRELRNKMLLEDRFTEEDKQLLQTLPNDVKVLVAAYAVEPWKDYSGILASEQESLWPHWDADEQLLPLAIRKPETIFTWIPRDKDEKSKFVVYRGFYSSSAFPYPPELVFDVTAATVDGTGRNLITGDDQGYVWFWNVESRELLGREQISSRKITALAVSSNNKYLLVSDNKPRLFWFEIQKLHERETQVSRFKRGFCCGIKGLFFSITHTISICRGTGIACDALNRIVLVEDSQKTEGQGVIWVHWYGYDQSKKELDYVDGCRLAHEGTVRSVVLNREATRLAVAVDNKAEMKKHELPFYYTSVTLWDLVQKERLIQWMCRKSMRKEPVHQVAIRGHDTLIIQDRAQRILVVHAPQEDSYEKRTTQFKQGYALQVYINNLEPMVDLPVDLPKEVE